MKVPVNLTIEEEVIKSFRTRVETVGLSVSGVIEVFMRAMNDDGPYDRMEKMINCGRAIREAVKNLR